MFEVQQKTGPAHPSLTCCTSVVPKRKQGVHDRRPYVFLTSLLRSRLATEIATEITMSHTHAGPESDNFQRMSKLRYLTTSIRAMVTINHYTHDAIRAQRKTSLLLSQTLLPQSYLGVVYHVLPFPDTILCTYLMNI